MTINYFNLKKPRLRQLQSHYEKYEKKKDEYDDDFKNKYVLV